MNRELTRRGLVLTMVFVALAGRPVRASNPERSAAAPSPPTVIVKAIESYCSGLRPFTKKKHGLRLGLYEKDQHDRGEWQEFKSDSQLRAAQDSDHVFDVAEIWRRDDGAVVVSMTLTSGSGDWVHFVDYCFRPDRTLARLSSTLNTFNAVDPDHEDYSGGAARERTRYFDVQGNEVRMTSRILNLDTKKPAPKMSPMDQDERVFKTLDTLPFARFIIPTR